MDEYQSIPKLQKPVDPSSGEVQVSVSERGDPTDGDYVDPGLAFQSKRAWRLRDPMIKAIDDMNHDAQSNDAYQWNHSGSEGCAMAEERGGEAVGE